MTTTPNDGDRPDTSAPRRKQSKKKLTPEDVRIAAKGGDEAFNTFVETGRLPGVERARH